VRVAQGSHLLLSLEPVPRVEVAHISRVAAKLGYAVLQAFEQLNEGPRCNRVGVRAPSRVVAIELTAKGHAELGAAQRDSQVPRDAVE
jgi:hypothetical protein